MTRVGKGDWDRTGLLYRRYLHMTVCEKKKVAKCVTLVVFAVPSTDQKGRRKCGRAGVCVRARECACVCARGCLGECIACACRMRMLVHARA